MLARVVHDVPDDEEVAGEIEALDEIEFAGDLRPRAIVEGPVTFARADLGDLAQERRLRLAGRHGIRRKAIPQVGHRVREPIRERARCVDGMRHVAEQIRHRRRRLEHALGVDRQARAGLRQRRPVPHARQHVEQRALVGRREPHAVGGNDRDAIRRRECQERLAVGEIVAPMMPLQLDVDVAGAEDADDTIEQPAHAVVRRGECRASDQRHQPGGFALEVIEAERPFALRLPRISSA